MNNDADGGIVVILTALDLEYRAVRTHLTRLQQHRHPSGTLFELGRLPDCPVRIALAVTSEGNPGAAVLTERAISMFNPYAVLFVGVAGGLKDDINLGDVVVATKVYAYHGGVDHDAEFLTRPRAWEAPHELDQLARHLARTDSWTRFVPPADTRPPVVHFKPIAAGEVVLNSRRSSLAEQLHRAYNDAVAIEMESAGVAQAGQLNRALPVLTVRGISDRADGGKHAAGDASWQPKAAANAAAFALALAAQVPTSHGNRHGQGRAAGAGWVGHGVIGKVMAGRAGRQTVWSVVAASVVAAVVLAAALLGLVTWPHGGTSDPSNPLTGDVSPRSAPAISSGNLPSAAAPPAASSDGLEVTLGCVPGSCATPQPQIQLTATVTGRIPNGRVLHVLLLVESDQRWFPRVSITPDVHGRWSGEIGIGDPQPQAKNRHFSACVNLVPSGSVADMTQKLTRYSNPYGLPEDALPRDREQKRCIPVRRLAQTS